MQQDFTLSILSFFARVINEIAQTYIEIWHTSLEGETPPIITQTPKSLPPPRLKTTNPIRKIFVTLLHKSDPF